MRSRRPSAAGRRKGPEAVTEQKTGYITVDTLQSKVVICTLAAEVPSNCRAIRAARSAVTSLECTFGRRRARNFSCGGINNQVLNGDVLPADLSALTGSRRKFEAGPPKDIIDNHGQAEPRDQIYEIMLLRRKSGEGDSCRPDHEE
jgi:hypothetical protein